MEILIPVLVTVALILLNGLFVAAEFAIIGVPKTAIARRANAGDPLAKIVLNILTDPRKTDRYIATAQLGITFASLGLGMYGEHSLAQWLAGLFEGLGAGKWIAAHTLASIIALGILTYLHIVVGEMVPKSLALMYAEKTVIVVTRPMQWFKILMYPLIVALNGLGNGILRLIGVDRQAAAHSQIYTPHDLEILVQESEEGGQLQEETSEVLLELFGFGQLSAGEVMVPRVRVIGMPLGASPPEITAILNRWRHTRYPIYQANLDQVTGTVHIKDLMRILLAGGSIQEKDVRTVPFIPESTSLERVFSLMRSTRSHMAMVMDEHGGTAGLITMQDVVEEVVGEIDEMEPSGVPIRREAGGRLLVMGIVRLDELGEELELDLEHEEVDSVSGLVLMLLERPPVVGDLVSYKGVTFEVTAVEGHGLKECLVTPQLKGYFAGGCANCARNA